MHNYIGPKTRYGQKSSYNYYQARLTSLRNGEWDEPEEPDIENVVDILEAHKDKILVVYNPY